MWSLSCAGRVGVTNLPGKGFNIKSLVQDGLGLRVSNVKQTPAECEHVTTSALQASS